MPPEEITIRLLTLDDWPLYKVLRLKALRSDPKSFGSTYAREADYTDTDWQNTLADPRTAIFAAVANQQLVGMTGVYLCDDMISAALWGVWVEREYRRQGISGLLYKACIEWTEKQDGIEKLIVSRRDNNVASGAMSEKHGFSFTHTVPDKVWRDGTQEPEHHYEMKISRHVSRP